MAAPNLYSRTNVDKEITVTNKQVVQATQGKGLNSALHDLSASTSGHFRDSGPEHTHGDKTIIHSIFN